jgi:hypothetical protein
MSGQRFELWLLKLALGGVAARSFRHGDSPVERLGGNATFAQLSEILFRGAQWPDQWGFYVFPRTIDPTAPRVGIGIDALTDQDGGLRAIRVDMGVVGIDLAFGVPGQALQYRPGALALLRKRGRLERIAAFAWPTPGHAPVTFERTD